MNPVLSLSGERVRLEQQLKHAKDALREMQRVCVGTESPRYKEVEGDAEECRGALELIKEEEAVLMRSITTVEERKMAEGLNAVAPPLIEVLDCIRNVKMYRGTQNRAKRYTAWAEEQQEAVEEGKETLQGHRKKILELLNAFSVSYRTKNPHLKLSSALWCSTVAEVEAKFLEALEDCAVANVTLLKQCIEGVGSWVLFSSSAKLNSTSRLNFTPPIPEIPTFLTQAIDHIVQAAASLDHLHCSLDTPVDVTKEQKTPIKNLLHLRKAVVQAVDACKRPIKALPDHAVRFICSLEDDYKTVWHRELAPWSVMQCNLMISKLASEVCQSHALGGLVIDCSALYEDLKNILEEEVSSRPPSQPRTLDTDSDPDGMMEDPYLAKIYHPPPTEAPPHVNPLLLNPPKDLEQHWAGELETIRGEFSAKKQQILHEREAAGIIATNPVPMDRTYPVERSPEPPKPAEKLVRPPVDEELEELRKKKVQQEVEAEQNARREREMKMLQAQEMKMREEEAAARAAHQKKLEAELLQKEEEEERQKKMVAEIEAKYKASGEQLVGKRTAQHHDVLGKQDMPGTPPELPPKPMTPGTSLHQIYRRHCQQHGIKPNSGVLRMLPTEIGTHMTELNLGLNYIGVKGVVPLLEVLRRNRGLKVLNLQDNNLENGEIR